MRLVVAYVIGVVLLLAAVEAVGTNTPVARLVSAAWFLLKFVWNALSFMV